jgi:hypothetical protein
MRTWHVICSASKDPYILAWFVVEKESNHGKQHSD